tara:strand:+ start:4827 stop:5171 length:345 start_codon:yes stop_codon:yes gene_type:complete
MKQIIETKSISDIKYHQMLNLLVIEGYLFRMTELDSKCIELIGDYIHNMEKLTVCIKADMIDMVSYKALEKLVIYLNSLKGLKKGVCVKWVSVPESMSLGKQLQKKADYSFIIN